MTGLRCCHIDSWGLSCTTPPTRVLGVGPDRYTYSCDDHREALAKLYPGYDGPIALAATAGNREKS